MKSSSVSTPSTSSSTSYNNSGSDNSMDPMAMLGLIVIVLGIAYWYITIPVLTVGGILWWFIRRAT
jgi:hypothetical protein